MVDSIRIVLGPQAYLDIPAPDGFDMTIFVTTIRANQFYYDGARVFIPYHSIEAILLIDPSVPSIVQGMTKQ